MRVLREALAGFRRTPLLLTLSVGATALSLIILGLFGLAVHNIAAAIGDIERRVEVVGYLLDDASAEHVRIARAELGQLPGVSGVRYVSKTEALANARRDLVEFSQLYGDLQVNPLPASFHLRLQEDFRTPEAVRDVAAGLAAYPFIEEVRFGDEWVERLFVLRRIATVAAIALGGGFALVAVLLVGTAVRMAVLARREEIEIMRIVGARDGYIRRPYVVEGAITGLTGGLLGIGGTRLAYIGFRAGAGGLERLDELQALAWLPDLWAASGVAGAAALGMFAAAYSVNREVGRNMDA